MTQRRCRICRGEKFGEVIDMGKNPLVNSLISVEDLDKTEEEYPLVVERCEDCSLVQVVNPIDSQKIYRDVDYLYFSSDMPTLREYFDEYAEELKERFLAPGDFALEIGSNDGLFLELLSDAAQVLGVDPASNVVVRSLKRGVPALSDFFSDRIAKSIVREFGKAKLIVGNNCIAHIDDLCGVMRGVKTLLLPKGVFVIECNYWGSMVEQGNYSLIYHDHFSYFTVHTWMKCAERFGMKVFDAKITPAQGGSLRIFLSNNLETPMTQRCADLLAKEIETNLNSHEACREFRDKAFRMATMLKKTVRDLKTKRKTIAGYGAAAKGFSILKLAGIDQTHIDYFVDDSPAKQGRYTPITHIPVISRMEIENRLPDFFFITAPNYEKVIVEKESAFRKRGGKFITADNRVI